jgi:hypothetical protein
MEGKKPSVLRKAVQDGLGGGVPGMLAMMAQVSSLMWLRALRDWICCFVCEPLNAMFSSD